MKKFLSFLILLNLGCTNNQKEEIVNRSIKRLIENGALEYDDFKKYALKSAKILHSEWSWASVADKILTRLEFYENSLL